MFCPKCFSDTRVYDSRPKDDTVWRRRECLECGQRFTTLEDRRNGDWPVDAARVRQQRDDALRALRRLDVSVREIALITGISENYVGQITKG